jgi:hypothetical protein
VIYCGADSLCSKSEPCDARKPEPRAAVSVVGDNAISNPVKFGNRRTTSSLGPGNSTNEANYVPWLCLEKRNEFGARWNLRKESQTILEITGQF